MRQHTPVKSKKHADRSSVRYTGGSVPQRPRHRPVHLLAEKIYDRFAPDERTANLHEELTQLGCGKKNAVREYYVSKISTLLLISLICVCALAGALLYMHRQNRAVEGGLLERPGYGESSAEMSLNLKISGEEESEAMNVQLDPRLYTDAEVTKLLQAAEEELLHALPGDNDSTDEIRTPVSIPSALQDGAVSAEYYITPAGMIDEDGAIIGEPDEEGTLVTILATLTCQEHVRTVECAARICPPLLSEEDALRKKIRDAVASAQTENPSGASMQLPQDVDGRTLSWSYPQDPAMRMILLIALILPAAVWVHQDSKVRDKASERKAQLELDYSQLLWKLTMLLSAGLTIRGSFSRIAAQYEAQLRKSTGSLHSPKKQKMQKRYAYEEMLLTLREMQSGVPEAAAYENFGRRCALPSYIKLGSLLSQNLKKGSRGLTTLLENEAILSLEQHKMAVRKMGEKAGIRILLPMIMMFAVVLIILMIPAFLSM